MKLRKWTALLLAMLMMALPAMGHAASSTADKLLNRWSSYLSALEQLISAQLRAYDAILAFDQSRSWDDLRLARAAVGIATTARSEIGRVTLTPGLSATDIARLEAEGVDIQPLIIEMDGLNADLAGDLAAMLEMGVSLYESVFADSMMTLDVDYAALMKQRYEEEARYACLLTNHMLLGVNDENRAAAYWGMMDFMYPTLASCKQPWQTDDAVLEEMAVRSIEALEAWTEAYNAHTGRQEHALNVLLDLVEKEATLVQDGEIILIEGMPTALPYPAWWGDMTRDMFFYYTLDEEGSMQRMDASTEPGTLPDVSVVATRRTVKADVIAYADLLVELGMRTYSEKGSPEDEGEWSRTIVLGEIQLILSWNNGTAYLWNLQDSASICVPTWYMQILNAR